MKRIIYAIPIYGLIKAIEEFEQEKRSFLGAMNVAIWQSIYVVLAINLILLPLITKFN